jgi:hypothetical protein
VWVQRTGSGGRPWEEVVSSQREFTGFLPCRGLRRRRFSQEKRFLGFTLSLFINRCAMSEKSGTVHHS